MRYIGGKSLLLERIKEVISRNCPEINSVIDIFTGSGVVATYFKECGWQVDCNDILYFSYVLQRASIGINAIPKFEKLKDITSNPLKFLNEISIKQSGINIEDCFIYQNYSPGGSARMYFQEKNALKIDLIRITIEKWKTAGKLNEDEYFYLLASLINAVPFVANITGVYAAYLKFWDKRTYNDLILNEIPIIPSKVKHSCYNCDYTTLLNENYDLLYADPPYNQREYAPNYHVLETIARYDYPAIKGITGMRGYKELKSQFCSKRTVKDAFETLLRDCRSRHILISYNNEGLISTEELSALCEKYAVVGTFKLFEYNYRRYKNKIPNNTSGLKEQLYYLRRF